MWNLCSFIFGMDLDFYGCMARLQNVCHTPFFVFELGARVQEDTDLQMIVFWSMNVIVYACSCFFVSIVLVYFCLSISACFILPDFLWIFP